MLGRMKCDIRLYDQTTTVTTAIAIYPGSTCLNHIGTTINTDTIIFDGRNEPNPTFYVRSRGFKIGLNSGSFQFTYINGANSTRMYWTDSRVTDISWGTSKYNTTLEGNFFFNNLTLSYTRLTVIGSLMTKYVSLNNAATLNVYPFSNGGTLTGDIFNLG